jgi:uncharacterized protein
MRPRALYVAAALVALGLLFAVRIAVRSYLAERNDFVRSPSSYLSRHPAEAGIPDLGEISFAGADHVRLAGWYAPSRNTAAIVIVHGTEADRSALLLETKILAQAGFGVLALDLPGQGASGGNTLWGVAERRAISAAIDWLTTRGEVDPQRIGGFGQSMGAYILTQAAVLDRRLRAVMLSASPSDVVEQNWWATSRWGLLSQLPAYWALRASGMPLDMQPRDVIGGIAPRAVFILGGNLDDVVPVYMARQLYQSAGEPKELWIVQGAHHGDYARVAPQEYYTRLVGYFRRNLLN